MARIRQFRIKSHHYAQLLSAALFLLVLNFQNCSRVNLKAEMAKAKTPVNEPVAMLKTK